MTDPIFPGRSQFLNPEQTAAACHWTGPALVLAGPGTGKTTTLVARYRYLIENGIGSSQILATTFTRAAARQLKQRISLNTGLALNSLEVGTFHALCLRLLDGEIGQAIGLTERIRPVSDGDRYRILRDVADRSLELEDCLDTIDRYKDRLIDPSQARGELAGLSQELRDSREGFVSAYEGYQRRMTAEGLRDFGDLLMMVVSALSDHPDLRRFYSQRYQFVMIDEFQDVNPAQYAFIRLLLDQHSNVWAVGDDDQAIYGWRGSDVRYILGFSEAYPGTRTYRLSDNYRSQPRIVERSTQLVANNKSRLEKPLRSVAVEFEERAVTTCGASEENAEADWVALAIQELAGQGIPLEEIAVLVRARYLMPTLTAALAASGLPHFVRGGAKIWNSTPAKAFLGGVALWANGSPRPWNIPTYIEKDIATEVEKQKDQPFEKLVRRLSLLVKRRMPFREQPEKELEWEGIVERVVTESKSFDDASQFLARALEETKTEMADREDAGVCVSTIHQAKGLEWRAVFLAGCEVGVMPHAKATDPEEERRLTYVAMTRAKERLAVTWAHSRGKRPTGPSVYVSELTAGADRSHVNSLVWPEGFSVKVSKPVSLASVREFAPEATDCGPFCVGARVRHPRYGLATIVNKGASKVAIMPDKGSRRLVCIEELEEVDAHERG